MSNPLMQFKDSLGLSVKAVYLLLLQYDKYSYLPEIFDLVGESAMVKLLDRFAGLQIKFPTEGEILDVVRCLKIYSRLSKIQAGKRAPVIDELASDLDMTPLSVYDNFNRTKKELENRLGIGFGV